MTLAAIRVKNGEIVQHAGRAEGITITPQAEGFIIHGATGPAPTDWIQSPDEMVVGWDQVEGGIHVWTEHPEPTLRVVPDVVQEPDEEGSMPKPLPEPDWSRVMSIADAQELQHVTVAKHRATELAQRKAADELLDNLPDKDVETLTYLYPKWDGNGVAYETDHKVRYQGVLYKVLQNHTSQPDWTPDTATSLYVRFRNPAAGPQPWVQPTGAQDAYATGEQVTHDNPNDAGNIWVYESAIDANTTEPGRDGTFDRYWTPVAPA